MKTRTIHQDAGQRTLVAILETGDEAMACLTQLARDEKLGAAQLSAIGAFSEAELKYFDWESKAYQSIPVREQVEVAAFTGDIALDDRGEPVLHVHVVLGRRDGNALAGHLGSARVRPTLEVVITESPAHLRRVCDRESGLALIRPDR